MVTYLYLLVMRPLGVLIKKRMCTYKTDSPFKEYLSFFACRAFQFRWTPLPGDSPAPWDESESSPRGRCHACEQRHLSFRGGRWQPSWQLCGVSLRGTKPGALSAHWVHCAWADVSLTSGLCANYILLSAEAILNWAAFPCFQKPQAQQNPSRHWSIWFSSWLMPCLLFQCV